MRQKERPHRMVLYFYMKYNKTSVGIPTAHGGDYMAEAIKSYDAKIDSKKRITLRNALFEYFHVQEYDDGRIVLEPRELTVPFSVSTNTLNMMDQSVASLKTGKVSEAIDLSEFEEESKVSKP